LEGTYRPKPVREIRLLGIPTVVDRMIQQAIAQVLSPYLKRLSLKIAMDLDPKEVQTSYQQI